MIIYKATNKINGKSYIGQTIKSLERRKQQHYCNAFTLQLELQFYKALRKHGRDNFDWTILCNCSSLEEMNNMETVYIESYNTLLEGYNMTEGGYSSLPTEETKQKISQSLQGRVLLETTKQRMSITRKKKSQETGYRPPSFEGKNHTKQHKEYMSELFKGSNSTLSKKYIITTPEGVEIIIDGIRNFAKKHGLTHQLLISVAKGKQKHHKGYKCTYYEG